MARYFIFLVLNNVKIYIHSFINLQSNQHYFSMYFLIISRLSFIAFLLTGNLIAYANSSPSIVDSFELPNGRLVVADQEQFKIIVKSDLTSQTAILSSSKISNDINVKRTKQLILGVFTTAWLEPIDIQPKPNKAQYSLPRYVYSLAASKLTIDSTPPMMRATVQNLLSKKAPKAWIHFFEKMAKEEDGHELTPVADINALGIAADSFFKDYQPAGTVKLVEYGWKISRSNEPVATVGYAYALQRSSLLLDKKIVEKIEAIIPIGVVANSSLRLHSGVGQNAKHVAEIEEFIATLPPQAKESVLLAIFESISILKRSDSYPGDEEMKKIINRYLINNNFTYF